VLVSESTYAQLPEGSEGQRVEDLELKGIEGMETGWIVRSLGRVEGEGP